MQASALLLHRNSPHAMSEPNIPPGDSSAELREQFQHLQTRLAVMEDDLRCAEEAADLPDTALLAHLPTPALLLRANGQIAFANESAAHLLHADASEALVGRSFTDEVLHAPVSPSELLNGTNGPCGTPAQHRVHCADGHLLPVKLEAAPVPDAAAGAPSMVLVSLSGIRDRKRLSETLHQTLDLFRQLFDLGPAALLLVRMRDGLILEASEQLLALSGFTADALIGATVYEVPVGVSRDQGRDLARHLLQHRRMDDCELHVCDKDGRERAVMSSARLAQVGGTLCALISFVDITPRKDTAAAERESRIKADRIFQASPAPLGIYRLSDGHFLEVNEALCTLLGHSREALLDRSWSCIWGNDDAYAHLNDRLRTGDPVHNVQATLRDASEEPVTVLASFQRLSLDGTPCVLMAMTDVTSRMRAHSALQHAKEKAESARQKEEEVSVFRSSVLANITHEVRTPLTTILGFTTVLHDGVDDRYKRFVDLIDRSGRRLLLMLDSLLDLAQLEAGTMTMPLASHCVQDLLHTLSIPLQTRVEAEDLAFRLDVPDGTPVCATLNEDLMDRVLTHLVDNAVKFTREGNVTLRMVPTDAHVDVRVEDTGPGIADEFLPSAFDAFTQESKGSTRAHQGSGLGLTVSQRIMEYMGGSIHIDTEKEKGTTIILRLQREDAC